MKQISDEAKREGAVARYVVYRDLSESDLRHIPQPPSKKERHPPSRSFRDKPRRGRLNPVLKPRKECVAWTAAADFPRSALIPRALIVECRHSTDVLVGYCHALDHFRCDCFVGCSLLRACGLAVRLARHSAGIWPVGAYNQNHGVRRRTPLKPLVGGRRRFHLLAEKLFRASAWIDSGQRRPIFRRSPIPGTSLFGSRSHKEKPLSQRAPNACGPFSGSHCNRGIRASQPRCRRGGRGVLILYPLPLTLGTDTVSLSGGGSNPSAVASGIAASAGYRGTACTQPGR